MSKRCVVLAGDIPKFALYGEQRHAADPAFVHIELIETRSRPHDWHISRHVHPGLFQILFLLGGHVAAHIGEAASQHSGPLAITINPSVAHGFDFSAQAHGYVLTLDQNVIFSTAHGQADLYSPLFVQPLSIALSADPAVLTRLVGLLRNLHDEAAWPEFGHALMTEWLARSTLLLLLRIQAADRLEHRSGRADFELFSRFRAEVEQHYKDQWPVGRYADVLRITSTRLNRVCLKLSGQSAFELAQERLMLEARRKLTYLPATIASIAYELGFDDPAYFSRLFRKRVGVTPTAFRLL